MRFRVSHIRINKVVEFQLLSQILILFYSIQLILNIFLQAHNQKDSSLLSSFSCHPRFNPVQQNKKHITSLHSHAQLQSKVLDTILFRSLTKQFGISQYGILFLNYDPICHLPCASSFWCYTYGLKVMIFVYYICIRPCNLFFL